MTICYNKLWKLLIDKNMKKKDLQALTGLSASSIAKLSRDEMISMDSIELVKEETHDCLFQNRAVSGEQPY